MEAAKVLFVDDDPGMTKQLRWAFSEFETRTAGNRQEAIKTATEFKPAIVVLDLGMPPDVDGATEGLKTLAELKKLLPSSKIIILSGNEQRENAVSAVRLGAYDFCQKPMDVQVLRLIIERAINLYLLEQDYSKAVSWERKTKLQSIITGARNMREACDLVEKVAPTDASVLLLGESGTGKELFAQALHDLSPRKAKPFVPINCGAIPETLLESELFGHEKGAFTGADRAVVGKIEIADGGTLFLDEIGDMPFTLQVKLLRFLQDRVVERVGSRKPIPVDIRVISATNQDIDEQISNGKFREDLYFRINEVEIKIPPLRERSGDPELLACFFLESLAASLNKRLHGFSEEAMAAIRNYPWPGNVRELQNYVKRAVIMARGAMIELEDLRLPDGRRSAKTVDQVQGTAVLAPGSTVPEAPSGAPKGSLPTTNLKEVRGLAERQAVEAALAKASGNVTRAAKLLGISRPTLYTLLSQHEIAWRDESREDASSDT